MTNSIRMGSLVQYAAAGVRNTHYRTTGSSPLLSAATTYTGTTHRSLLQRSMSILAPSSRLHSTKDNEASSSSIQSWHFTTCTKSSTTTQSILLSPHDARERIMRGRFGIHKEEARSSTRRIFSTIARGGATTTTTTATDGSFDANEAIDNKSGDGVSKKTEIAYIAVGSNLGDRFVNIRNAMELLESYHLGEDGGGDGSSERRPMIQIRHTSHLHQTAAMYVTDQPAFLNGVICIDTTLSPHELLVALKEVEQRIGRDLKNGIRNGPRLIDMDILFYGVVSPPGKKHAEENYDDGNRSGSNHEDVPRSGGCILQTPDLEIPHPRLEEREFVLLPLCELDQTVVHPIHNVTLGELFKRWNTRERQNHATTSTSEIAVPSPPPPPRAVRVLPLPRNRMLFLNETLVMGILNVTPDSFSDGGRFDFELGDGSRSCASVERATQEALQMVTDGASIIDIGGESTRPGAKEIHTQEELERTIPVIQSIRQVSDIPISIDTRHATVAKAAIEAGADIVNDVSGGTFDPDMLSTVAELKVPMILMHMRGTPQTMQGLTHYRNNDVVSDVAFALLERSMEAERAGIPRWLQVLDPGIGFAKDLGGNLQLLKHMGKLRELVGPFPLLLGPSRKGFIGTITGETEPKERDYGTVASCVAAVCRMNPDENGGSSNILRVHNVKGVKQAAMIMDAIRQAE
eukprot:CAMPEP_0198295056 /NCGR_PEP_ID=MMETSP1449-20131203/25571_1 /TAXON_ID=420275 /ORGANISM="Attheya septentrionalis, Strain CCMP2084" /LENGTH=688 /DNA_ID=CAMNT_0043995227 /DNA_START=297 /DNA_END=2363 /DNA_ORIENTATION=+